MDLGSWLFVIIDVIAVVALLAAMLYRSRIGGAAPHNTRSRQMSKERRLYHRREHHTGRARDSPG